MSKKLGHVLNAVRDLELARLSAATENQHAVAREITAFRTALTEVKDRAFDPDCQMAPGLLNADIRWRQWAETWTRAKHGELARRASTREQQKSRTLVAFARAAAFDALVAKQKKRARRK